MKVVMLMFDSLNRHMLPPYGDTTVHAPNFTRLAARSATFDRSYICSMPCMPCRRDLHTARPNFLYRSWGPLEPFDDSVPRMLRQAGVTSHLISDHYHYWEAGGATYHTQYSTWQFFRGQEGDPWIGQAEKEPATGYSGRNAGDNPWINQDRVNRKFMRAEEQMAQAQTMTAGLEFLDRNHQADRWFLQIETFDPHEPFFNHRKYQDRYPEHFGQYDGPINDWPGYDRHNGTPAEEEHLRYEYKALLSMCDSKLGDLLDRMDKYQMWDDTMLIVWTDHGFLMGEHEWWAKMRSQWFEELSHTPFFVWDPRAKAQGVRRQALVQPALDLGPTLLEFFGLKPTPDMTGKVLRDAIAQDAPVREAAIFGGFGHQVNVTDGRFVYYRAPARDDNRPLYNYTLMPTNMRELWSVDILRTAELVPGFKFTKGCKLLRVEASGKPGSIPPHLMRSELYDLAQDPKQAQPINDPATEQRLIGQMTQLMRECDAPAEQFERIGLAGK